MRWLRRFLGLGAHERPAGDAELVRAVQLLEERLTLRFDELAAEASALSSYVEGQLSRSTGEAPPLQPRDRSVGAVVERITDDLDTVEAALDQVDQLLARSGDARKPATKLALDLYLLGRAKRRSLATSDEDLLRIVRVQATALRALARAVRETARIQDPR